MHKGCSDFLSIRFSQGSGFSVLWGTIEAIDFFAINPDENCQFERSALMHQNAYAVALY